MDYQSLLFNPIYGIQGVPAAIFLADGTLVDGITALDKTAGIDVGGGDVQVQTLAPAACVRVSELTAKGVALDDLIKARLLMNGNEWRVVSHRAQPSPKGERDGEVYLILANPRELSTESEPTEPVL
jgi:hypothetical protein